MRNWDYSVAGGGRSRAVSCCLLYDTCHGVSWYVVAEGAGTHT